MSLHLVDIVILNFNTLDLLRRCLNNLLGIGVVAEQITVVDNASSDGSREWLKSIERPPIQVIISTENLGFAGGNNLAIRSTLRPFVLLLNTDAFPKDGSIEALVEVLNGEPKTAVVGPQLLYPDGRWQRSTGRIPSPRSAMLDACGFTSFERMLSRARWKIMGPFSGPVTVGYVDGACLLIRRSILDMVGLLDENLFFFVEDADFCARVQDAGHLVRFVQGSKAIHLRGASSSQKDQQHAAIMKKKSLYHFVTERYGTDGWYRFCTWTQRNYLWRYTACRFGMWLGIDLQRRCAAFLAMLDAFQEDSVPSAVRELP